LNESIRSYYPGRKVTNALFAITILLMSLLVLSQIHIVSSTFKSVSAQPNTTTTTPATDTTTTCTNLPVTGITAIRSDAGYPPSNTQDNNLNTRWSNNGIGSWIRVDLGSQKTICTVDIAWYLGNQRQNNFIISVSNDGNSFTNVFSGKSSGTTLSPERYDITDVNARYVRITVDGNTQNAYASITEIDVYGSDISQRPPIADKSYDINVLVIKYFPLTEQGTVDVNVTGETTLQGVRYELIRQKTIDMTDNLVASVERATTYLGYKDPAAKPALRHHIFDTIEHKEPVPTAPKPGWPYPYPYPDYNGIMLAHDICNYVDNKNVREVWLFAYQGSPTIKLGVSESIMSGPHGEISNSFKPNVMPLCKHTYLVYTPNYGRTAAEMVEAWGHQLEVEFSAINPDLFRNKFQGPPYPPTENVNGRCGSDHNPPNARFEYDRWNPNPCPSDCLDWNPDGLGKLSQISCQNWGCIFPTCEEYLFDFWCKQADANQPQLKYNIWNSQNMPGINNTKTYQGQPLRSWWDVYGDFDNVMANSKRLTR
jgi:hypothetical protein